MENIKEKLINGELVPFVGMGVFTRYEAGESVK